MRYFAKIVEDAEGYYQVSFLELDGCFTYGDTLEDALANAAEALDGWLEAHFSRTQHVPAPKLRRGKHYYAVRVNPQIALAVALRAGRRERKLTQRQVARKLGIDAAQYAKFELPQQANPSLATISKLADILDIDISFDLAS